MREKGKKENAKRMNKVLLGGGKRIEIKKIRKRKRKALSMSSNAPLAGMRGMF
jgi:hypothetical protein